MKHKPNLPWVFHHAILAGAIIYAFSIVASSIAGYPPLQSLIIPAPAITLVFIPLMITIFLMASLQEISADQLGLTVVDGYRGKPQRMLWEEIHLFAVVGPGRVGDSQYIYKVASRSRTLIWARLQRQPRRQFSISLDVATVAQPAVAVAVAVADRVDWDTYEQQMEAILAVIATRTGLPLYDLRAMPTHRMPNS